MRNISRKLLNAPYIVWAALFIVIPMVIVIYYTFTDQNGAFTMSNLAAIADYKDVMLRSFWYAIIATVICLVLAYPVAYCMSRMKPGAQRFVMMLIMLPMWMNLLIRTYSWTTILEKTGIINSFLGLFGIEPVTMIGTPGAVILGMVYNYLPYMILPIYTVMQKIDISLLEAAEDLGSNTISKLRRVILPLSMPGVISGITMVFVPSVSTFYISQKLGGLHTVMIGDIIQQRFDKLSYNIGASLSFVLMIVIFICMIVMNRFADDEDGGIIV
ncbi:MAG: ABC transporter permease [Acutalibacteraceae bacterium]|nr:ABC transporter permease [Acutalibacteraceae bacterium]